MFHFRRHLAILEQKYEQLQEEMIAKLEQMIVRWKNCLNEYNEKMMIWTRDMRLRAIEAYSNMLEEMESKSEVGKSYSTMIVYIYYPLKCSSSQTNTVRHI